MSEGGGQTSPAPPLPWEESATLEYERVFQQGDLPTPSQQENHVPLATELAHRYLGCHLIQRAGRLIKLYKDTLLHLSLPFPSLPPSPSNFLSKLAHNRPLSRDKCCFSAFTVNAQWEVAMACVLIATKVEECGRRVRDIVNIFHWLYSKIRHQETPYRMIEYVGEEYYRWKDRVIDAEMAILRELGFHVQPSHPMGLLVNYLNALEILDVRISQRAINYLNDALRTVVYLCYSLPVVACAAISLAAEDFGLDLPKDDRAPWWAVFDVQDQTQLTQAKAVIRSAYSFKVDFTNVPLTREELSRGQQPGAKEEGNKGIYAAVGISQSREEPYDRKKEDVSGDHHDRGRSRDRSLTRPESHSYDIRPFGEGRDDHHHYRKRSPERGQLRPRRDKSYGPRSRSRSRSRSSRSRSNSRSRSRHGYEPRLEQRPRTRSRSRDRLDPDHYHHRSHHHHRR